MQNYIQPGKVIPFTAAGTVTSGDLVAVGDIVGVATNSGELGDEMQMQISGVFQLPKVAGGIGAGQKVYFEPVSKKVTTASDDGGTPTPTPYAVVGFAIESVGSAATEVKVLLGR